MNPQMLFPRTMRIAAIITSVIGVGFILMTAKPILVPLALSILLSFLLSPMVHRAERTGLNHIMSVLLVVCLSLVLVGGVGYVVSSQMKSFADRLPDHKQNIEDKVLAVKSFFKGGTMVRIKEMAKEINKDTDLILARRTPTTEDDPKPETEANAEAETRQNSQVSAAGDADALLPTQFSSAPVVTSVLDILANAGLVTILVIFILIHQDDLRDRIVNLAGRNSLATTTRALEEAGERISKYLLMLFIINSTFGLAVAIGLALIGVPYAAMWGLAAGFLRFIPYIGPWVAAAMPIAVSMVTSQGWNQPMLVIGLFLLIELLSNNVMEPVLYGQSVGISEFGIIVAAVIWSWLWGPIGLVLATPMTVCLAVLGRYIPELSIFDQLLGENSSIRDADRLYQRLLARDAEDADDLVDDYRKDHTLIETADQLVLPTLELIRQDLASNRIDHEEAIRMNRDLNAILEDQDPDKPAKVSDESATPVALDIKPVRVVGFATQASEELAMLKLMQSVQIQQPCEFDILSNDLLQSEKVARVAEHAPDMVVISSMPPGDLVVTRQLCKRLRMQNPDLKVVVARWMPESKNNRNEQLVASGATEVVNDLASLSRSIDSVVQRHKASAKSANTPVTVDSSQSSRSSSQANQTA